MMAGSISGLREAAFWLSLFALFSQILALLRDRLLAHHFGAGVELDSYYAAFEVPDLIFVTIASLVSISALVPLFAKKETEGEKHLKDATDSIFTIFSVFIVFSCLLAWVLMPYIIPLAFGGLSAEAQEHTVFLSRILLFSPLFLGFSNFFGSIVQYEKRFILYSLSPLLYNLGIIFGIVFLGEALGIVAAAIGVVLGAFLHLFMQGAFIFFSPLSPRLTSKIKWSDVWETTKLSVPRTFAISIVSFLGFFFAAIASSLGEGSIAIFTLASNLQSAPLSLIGVSFSLAAFPALAISAAKKNFEDVTDKISLGLRQIIFWSMPFTFLMIILRAHIVRVILGSGVFDWRATRLTAAVLALFVFSTVFQSISLFLSRSHYALNKTKWPLIGNVMGGAASIVSAYFFMRYFDQFGFLFEWLSGALNVSDLSKYILLLPLAFSVGSIVSSAVLFLALGHDLSKEIGKRIYSSALYGLLAAAVAGFGAYLTLHFLQGFFDLDTFFGVFVNALIAGLCGIILGALALYFSGSQEFRDMVNKLR